MRKEKCSILSEIGKAEESIKECFYRVEVLEKNLKSSYISNEEREKLEKELIEVKQLLTKDEERLKNLHKENSKTFAVAVIIMFIAFLIYGIYVMWSNPLTRSSS